MTAHRRHSSLLALILAGALGCVGPVWAENEAPAGEFTLSLKNSDIHSLIGTVSKQTGRNFVVDPRVKAKVTVISSQPMEADELYEVFLSVLQVHGFSAVPTGDVIKIVPDVSAKQGPVPNLSDGDERDQLVTHVIRVDNVPAAQLVPILRPLVPQQGHLAAYASTNSLVITDRAANIKRLIGIIKRIDRPDNEEIEFVRLQHASASEVVRILNALQTNIAGAQAAGQPGGSRLAADERTNSVLISGDPASRLRLRGLIANLDTPLESGGNTKVVYLKYANAAELATIIQGVSAGQAKVGVSAGTAATAGQPAATPTRSSGGDNSVDIQADEHTNALIITAPPDAMRSILAVVRQLDIRRAQVLVEAIIAEISDDKTRSLGVSFGVDGRGSNNPIGFSNLGGGANEALAIGAGTATSVGNGLSLALGSFDRDGTDFGFLVRAIASDAANNILSTPSLVTLDNQEAEIVVGQNVPFVTGQTSSSNNDNPFQTIERQDVGLTLKVKPQINEGNSIKMEIDQEVSSVSTTSQASDIITNKRSIKTTVLVEDGQTLVLGGLIQDDLRDSQEKVPLLGDIPVLGRLFQYRSTVKAKQNLMVFLHPKILRDRETSDYYSSEKYSYLRSKQLVADEEGIGLLEGEAPLLPEIEVLFNGRKLSPPSGENNATEAISKQASIAREADLTYPSASSEALVEPARSTTVEQVDLNLAIPKPENAVEPVITVSRLRLAVNKLRARIVLDVNEEIDDRVEQITNDDGSFTVVLIGATLSNDFAPPSRPNDNIEKLTVDQLGETVRIHVVPSNPSTFRLQTLPPNNAGNYRFMIDVQGDGALASTEG